MKRILIPIFLIVPLLGQNILNPYRYAAAAGYSPNATTFAGTSQCWMSRADLSGNSDGKVVTISFWIDFSGGDGAQQYIFMNEVDAVRINKEPDNTIRFTFRNPAGTTLVDIQSSVTLTAAQGWHHVLMSIDKSVETRRHLYIDNVSSLVVNTFLSDDVDANTDNINRSEGNYAMGGWVSDGTDSTAACVAEFYVSYIYVDASNSANRATFYSGGHPAGDLTSVNSPIVYLKSIFSSFTVNSGSGGNFTKQGSTAFTSCTAP